MCTTQVRKYLLFSDENVAKSQMTSDPPVDGWPKQNLQQEALHVIPKFDQRVVPAGECKKKKKSHQTGKSQEELEEELRKKAEKERAKVSAKADKEEKLRLDRLRVEENRRKRAEKKAEKEKETAQRKAERQKELAEKRAERERKKAEKKKEAAAKKKGKGKGKGDEDSETSDEEDETEQSGQAPKKLHESGTEDNSDTLTDDDQYTKPKQGRKDVDMTALKKRFPNAPCVSFGKDAAQARGGDHEVGLSFV
jgi:hypothetical protein